MSDREIRDGLLASGVPEHVLHMTLPSIGQDRLRSMVASRYFGVPPSPLCKGLWVYSAPDRAAAARDAFLTLAKELFLYKTSVQVTDLLGLRDALMETGKPTARALFIEAFVEGPVCPVTSPEEVGYIRSYVRSRNDSGLLTFYLADVPRGEATVWWPQSFLSIIATKTEEFRVE